MTQRKRWQTAEFGLISKRTGEIFDAELRLAKPQGGKFMKVWQGTGWDKRVDELQGNSLKVLIHLLEIATWQNEVPGPSEVAKQMGKYKQHVSRAYSELVKANFLYKHNSGYRLSPLFCWKGNDEQYQAALAEVSQPQARITQLEAGLVLHEAQERYQVGYDHK